MILIHLRTGGATAGAWRGESANMQRNAPCHFGTLCMMGGGDAAAKTVDLATAKAQEKESARTSALLEALKENPEATGLLIASAADAAMDAANSATSASEMVAIVAKKLAEAEALTVVLAETLAEVEKKESVEAEKEARI